MPLIGSKISLRAVDTYFYVAKLLFRNIAVWENGVRVSYFFNLFSWPHKALI